MRHIEFSPGTIELQAAAEELGIPHEYFEAHNIVDHGGHYESEGQATERLRAFVDRDVSYDDGLHGVHAPGFICLYHDVFSLVVPESYESRLEEIITRAYGIEVANYGERPGQDKELTFLEDGP